MAFLFRNSNNVLDILCKKHPAGKGVSSGIVCMISEIYSMESTSISQSMTWYVVICPAEFKCVKISTLVFEVKPLTQ